MGISLSEAEDSRPPGAGELLPLLAIVGVVAWVIRSFEPSPWVSTRIGTAISIAGAGLIGLPALFWALDHGHRRLVALLALGVTAGLTPLLLVVLSGAAGLIVRAGPGAAVRILYAGAPIPGMGVMPWRAFARAEAGAAAIGAVSAAIYWMAFLARRHHDVQPSAR
jgi:hypothetical protein